MMRLLIITLFWCAIEVVLAETPPNEERVDPTEVVLIPDFPSPHDDQALDLEALLWEPAGEGPHPAIIMMHGSGGLYYQSDDNCEDSDRSCWGLSGKFRYWGKQLSVGHAFTPQDRFWLLPQTVTPHGGMITAAWLTSMPQIGP